MPSPVIEYVDTIWEWSCNYCKLRIARTHACESPRCESRVLARNAIATVAPFSRLSNRIFHFLIPFTRESSCKSVRQTVSLQRVREKSTHDFRSISENVRQCRRNAVIPSKGWCLKEGSREQRSSDTSRSNGSRYATRTGRFYKFRQIFASMISWRCCSRTRKIVHDWIRMITLAQSPLIWTIASTKIPMRIDQTNLHFALHATRCAREFSKGKSPFGTVERNARHSFGTILYISMAHYIQAKLG